MSSDIFVYKSDFNMMI